MAPIERLREFGVGRAIALALLVSIAVLYSVWQVRDQARLRTEVQRITRVVEGTKGEKGEPGEPGIGITDVIVRMTPPGTQAEAIRRAGGILHLFIPRAENGTDGVRGPRGPRGSRGRGGKDGDTIRGPRGRRGKRGAAGEGVTDARIAASVNAFLRTHFFICERQGQHFVCRVAGGLR